MTSSWQRRPDRTPEHHWPGDQRAMFLSLRRARSAGLHYAHPMTSHKCERSGGRGSARCRCHLFFFSFSSFWRVTAQMGAGRTIASRGYCSWGRFLVSDPQGEKGLEADLAWSIIETVSISKFRILWINQIIYRCFSDLGPASRIMDVLVPYCWGIIVRSLRMHSSRASLPLQPLAWRPRVSSAR